ncbi:SusC/RagA family TonB-linked outer membrane protein [Dyadobacter pollutisoli]|uniref:SusC/RagA family TonB-linked outer membrane protein n=1 Tax=Dyadobacter pollutisoli TaxID=2910158 RepID=A0A9E8SID3_9BACT|nr:SusC/RagA family TonB-linked outer membrane protein [Dyadobacter pollutisoli]WAC09618.1 SusC/RagA family TonB-linked outer membrane protein [Dyadobacter pollutisoli]
MKKILLLGALLVCSCSSLLWAQEKFVTGTVTAADDASAIPGVNIVVAGTNNGVITDMDGKYKIGVPDKGKLIFSFVGMISQELAFENLSVIDVKLVSDARILSEVVVTGSGVATTKAKLGISVETISGKNLPQTPSASVDQALVGKIPGAQITSGNGTPGASVNILLRGINSVNRGTSPMILIDGIQMVSTDLSSIDLNTIERIEVVQGAASASIYGAQGANGVIQLFTKRGKNGVLNIDFSSSITNNTYLNVGGMAKSQFHGYNTDANNNIIGSSGAPITIDPLTGLYSENVIWNSTDPLNKTDKPYNANLAYHDHFKEFFVPANTYNNSVSMSGGSEKFDFSASASNNHQKSNFLNNGYNDRSNLTTNLGVQLAKGLRLRSTTQLVYTKNTVNGNNIFSIFNSRAFVDYDFRLPDGSPINRLGDAAGVNGSNPIYAQHYSSSDDKRVDIIQNFNLNYKVNKYLELDAKYGLNYRREDFIFTAQNQSDNANSVAASTWVGSAISPDNTGGIDKYTYAKTFQNFLGTAFFYTNFQDDFHWNVPITTSTQVSFDYRNQKQTLYAASAAGLPSYTPFTSTQGTSFKVIEDYAEPFITYGYLVNQKIEYGELFGLAGGFRSDYSSAFGGGSKPFTFPRGDVYLRMSSFDFWKGGNLAGLVPEFKLRAAYGEAGIQPNPFDRYVTLRTKVLGSSNAFYFDPNQNNPDLSVEVSKELEIGTDLTVNLMPGGNWLNDVRLSATYWKRTTDNAIWNIDVAPTSGSGTLKTNAFSLGSHGLQASLNAAMYHGKNFTWNLTTNFTKQTSKINSVVGDQEIVIISSAGSTNYVLRKDEKIGQLYGHKMIHSLDAVKPDGTPFLTEAEKGNYTLASNGYVVDKATKFPYVTPDKYSFGDPNPKFNMSFINDLTFKNFLTFGFQLDWIQGSHLYNQTKEWMYRDGIHADYSKPFTIDGETGAWTSFYRGVYAAVTRNGTKDYFYEDASFLRLRNISLGVDFAKVTKIKGFRKLQLVLSGRNLFTLTKYTGMDPEIVSGANNSAWDRGTDHSSMPNYRSYQVSLNFGF